MLQFGDPRNIKVLVIGHKRELAAYVVEALHSYSFEVTCVYQSGAALRLLSENSSKFDLLLVDCSIDDVDIHAFLRETKNMDVLSIVMSEKDDDGFTINALKSGAFLVMKKPLTIEAVSHMRQNVMRERIRKRENHRNKNRYLKVERKDSGESSKQATNINYKNNLVFHWSEDESVRTMKKKACVEWTPELHAKFINAVIQLGEGRCYPKNILDLMAVPGLKRMQVASHLQKCRKEKWKNDEKLLNDFTSKRAFGRKFGCMPSIQKNRHGQEEGSKPIGFNLSMNGWHQKEVNHMTNQTERGSLMTTLNQRNIEQRVGYTPFSFQSGYGSKQDEGFDRMFTETTHSYIQTDAGQGVNNHTFAPNTSDDFPDFLRDLDGNGPNEDLIAENIAEDHSYGTPDEEMSDKYM